MNHSPNRDLATEPAPTPSRPGIDDPGLIAAARALTIAEGYNLTALPDVRILRSDRPLTDTPVLYDPGLVIVCQGSKRGFFGDQVYLYDQQHYLAVSVPVPFTMQSEGSPDRPLLAVYLHLDFRLAADLMLELDRHPEAVPGLSPRQPPRSMMSSPMDEALRHSTQHLLQVLQRPLEARILGPAALREVYFRVLTGPQGPALRAALRQQGQFGRIAKALRRIHGSYVEPLDLPQLAREAGMSVPSFHAHFKAITRTSPIQYLKSTRLHQARLLMLRQGQTAAAACHAVGYESASQFNREFKRLFGRTPAAEVRRMKADFAWPPAAAGSDYVSSH